jgi:hypothetical protein
MSPLMAEEETIDPEEEPDQADDETSDVVDELEDEIARLEARIDELEEELLEARTKSGGKGEAQGRSQAVTWAGWILGTLLGASSLALIVALLGGGFQRECNCPEGAAAGVAGQQRPTQMEQQHAALNQLIEQRSNELQGCFDSWATGNPEARPGRTINVAIEIEADDQQHVHHVSIRGNDVPESFSQCLELSVRQWRVPVTDRFVIEVPFQVAPAPLGDSGSSAAHPDGDPAPGEASRNDGGSE